MLYNFKNEFDCIKAKQRLEWLIENEKKVEIVEKKPLRSLSQNNYLHLILNAFAFETGFTLEEVKQDIFKKLINPDTFYDGEVGDIIKIERWRSTADLDTKEMALCIERFRDYSAKELGLYLPEPNDLSILEEIEKEIKNNPKYI